MRQQTQAQYNRDSTPQQRQARHNRGKHTARCQPDLILHAGRARSNSNPFYKTKTKKTGRNGPPTQAAPPTAAVVHGFPQKHKKIDTRTAILSSSDCLPFPPQRRGRSRTLCALCRRSHPGHPRPLDRFRGQRP